MQPFPTLRLTYFNGRGLAEVIRLVLAHCDIPYEDTRIEHKDWEQLKPSTPWGQLPVLSVEDKHGKIASIGQSGSIARFVGRLGQVVGSTPSETAYIESICDA